MAIIDDPLFQMGRVMAGERRSPVARVIDAPRPGYFKMRIVKGGPLVPCEIRYCRPRDPATGEELERSPMWEAWINGRLHRDPSPSSLSAGVDRIWLHAIEIDEAEFKLMTANKEWAEEHCPSDPAARPTERARLRDLPADRFRKR